MKRTSLQKSKHSEPRRGSTLLIVLALLGLLAFTGMVFYTFSAQERAAADYFSEAAKADISITDDPFPWGLQQILTGPTNNQKGSILWDPRQRHSMLRGTVGYDAVPHSGSGVRIVYNGAGLPVVDNDYDGTGDTFSAPERNPLNFVSSPAAWSSSQFGVGEGDITTARGAGSAFPEPDVDYTYPDINNLFLAHRGWGIRDNGAAHTPASQRYERVPVFIPSFFRPGLMKSSTANGNGGNDAPTDADWYDHSTATGHPTYALRSFRPSEHHIAGFTSGGTAVRRYIDATNAADAGLLGTIGAFPLRPNEDVNPPEFGRLGAYTGHLTGTPGGPDGANMRLDQDNDGDGVFEGIWLDLAYPVQETSSGELYVTMHSFTIYDLGALIDLNSHGNLTALNRAEQLTGQVAGAGGSSDMSTTLLSTSNQGLGPHEVSPIWALAPPTDTLSGDGAFPLWFGAAPTNRLEQANMELVFLTTGRIDSVGNVLDGRWGDASALWYHANNGRDIWSLPRPGRAGDLVTATTDAVSFGGRKGFDDNGNALEGIASQYLGVKRGFIHPLDIGGTGRTSLAGDPRITDLFQDVGTRPERWPRYNGVSLVGKVGALFNDPKYMGGRDQDLTTTADNLVNQPRYNLGFEDPLEMVNDIDMAVRPDDSMFSPADTVPAHLSSTDSGSSITTLSDRLNNLAVSAFAPGSNISERFTTISNTLRAVMHRHDLGPNLVSDGGSGDDGPRWFEWTADTDSDGKGEFPPQFGGPTGVPPFRPFDPANPIVGGDPFRAVVRRLLRSEAGEARDLINQLPLSINHILDVNRTSDTPLESSPEYLAYIKRAGMRFRPLTEHPYATETDSAGTAFASGVTTVPTVGTAAGTTALKNFPPRNLADREFWARRDRQQLARDIYVLLYTIGDGEVSGGNIKNSTGDNSGLGIYSHAELRRMAQFAVNMVDAMDPDDVITKFEYDKNLGDGWNLDDDAYTDDPGTLSNGAETDLGLYPLDTVTRGVVFGVEAQQLSFSEVLAVRLEDFAKLGGMANDPATMFDDNSSGTVLTNPDTERKDRYVLHLELQNNQPYPIPMSVNGVTGNASTGNSEQAIWQIARVDRNGGNLADPQATVLTETMSFMDGNPDVSGGARVAIGMATTANTTAGDSLRTDPLGVGTADLYLQPGAAANYPLISPDVAASPITAGGQAPKCYLDTIHTSHDTRYVYDVNDTSKGRFLQNIPYQTGGVSYDGNQKFGFAAAPNDAIGSSATGQGFEVVLRRRLNPNLPLAPLAENPWVEVDRVRVEFKDLFNFTNNMGTYTAAADFTQLSSDERDEPLDATDAVATGHPAAAADSRYNTIDNSNDRNASAPFSLWQPHFDRDFASVVELFHVPIVGPNLLTQRLQRMRFAPAQQMSASVGTVDPDGNPDRAGNAVAMFLQPDVLPQGNDVDDNAWYRLLQFVEVPSRVNTMLGDYLTRLRLPGKVNLNGIRHIEVYAGLIDNGFFADVPVYNVPGNAGSGVDLDNQFMPYMSSSSTTVTGTTVARDTSGAITSTYKDHWFEFIAERDGAVTAYNPITTSTTSFWLPGTPNARPFRSTGYRKSVVGGTSGSDTSIDETILRRFNADVQDGNLTTNRHWLEVGNSTFHHNPDLVSTATSQRERHQILGKLYNNSTTVSDSFIVYGTAAYFKAYEDPASGLIRVGSRMGLDVDGDNNETNDSGWEQRAVFVIDRTELLNAYDKGTGSFDWQRLIKYRADLPSDTQ